MSEIQFEGRSAIVTGGTRGIGKAIVEELAKRGANVAFNYSKSADEAEKLLSAIEAAGGKAFAAQCDVANTEAAADFVKQVAAEFGTVDLLVNNAGITRDQLMLRMKEDDWDAVIDTNLKSCFLMTKAVMRGMLRQRAGRIVNITSVSGLLGNAGQANYAASKAGMIGFTRTTAREVASRGITVNAVAPGFIETDIWATVTEQAREAILKMAPLGTIGKPEDVAEAVAFLASDAARYVTGQTLNVDGGLVMA
jgi:3-oxoacyl-[acyl-carrier protein] reductase